MGMMLEAVYNLSPLYDLLCNMAAQHINTQTVLLQSIKDVVEMYIMYMIKKAAQEL